MSNYEDGSKSVPVLDRAVLLQHDFVTELDTCAVDWCDDPNFFNMLQSRSPSPRHASPEPHAESATWEFVNYRPEEVSRHAKPALHKMVQKKRLPEKLNQKPCSRGGACTRCHIAKVVLLYLQTTSDLCTWQVRCIRTPGMADCG